jgi:hypothetical protein
MLPYNFQAAGFVYVATTCLWSNILTGGVLLGLGFAIERFLVARGRRGAE